MTRSNSNSDFPTLFAHSVRKEWGVGVFAGEKDGKRRYLFENGEERTLASGFDQMMQRVENPSADQQFTLARLSGVLAARAKSGEDAGKPAGFSIGKQLAKFREAYSAGFADPDWLEDVRGGARGKRATAMRDAQERLSSEAFGALLGSQQGAGVWREAQAILTASGLVPASQLALKQANGDALRPLGPVLRELLHGTGPYDQRFDRFVTAFTTAFGAAPAWDIATALPALLHPLDHVCVEPLLFKKQVKLCAQGRSITPRAASAGYAAFLSVTRLIANKLAEQGEAPRDLMDVRDFIIFTLKPAPKARPKPKAAAESIADDS
jgi:hypothetical protein